MSRSKDDSVFQDLGKSLNVDSLRILSRPKPDIFLCGGSADSSVRRLFMEYARLNSVDFYSRLVLAEEVIKSWFRSDSYDNLLELENDLASIASIVPIFLESPGSFAEVGAFSCIDDLIKKILVFQDEKYFDRDSFLNLGPLHKICKKCGKDSVLYYSWDNIALYFDDIKDNIIKKLNVKEKRFYKDRIGDISILVIEILNLSQLAKRNDIKCVLDSSKIDISLKDLDKIFYMLSRMHCIREIHAGQSRYYKSLCKDKMLKLAFNQSTSIRNIQEWQFKISQYYSASDRNWNNLQEQHCNKNWKI